MPQPASRRLFLKSAAITGAALAMAPAEGLAGLPLGGPAPLRADYDPPFRISLAQWSLHRALRAGDLDNLDFPRAAREDFGIEAVEYVNSFFHDKAGDYGYLGELRRRADDHGVRSLLIMVDGQGNLGEADDAERRRSIERHFKWIAASSYLGGHAIRVNAGGSGDRDEHSKRAADSLHRLCMLAEDYGVSVIVENHGGPSSDGAWLAQTIRRADHPRCGTLPDFGNFNIGGGRSYDRYQGIEELMPFAKALSAKSHTFDADGRERNTDYTRMMDIVAASGYRGWIGIEYEGGEHSEAEGIRLTKALLEREIARIGNA